MHQEPPIAQQTKKKLSSYKKRPAPTTPFHHRTSSGPAKGKLARSNGQRARRQRQRDNLTEYPARYQQNTAQEQQNEPNQPPPHYQAPHGFQTVNGVYPQHIDRNAPPLVPRTPTAPRAFNNNVPLPRIPSPPTYTGSWNELTVEERDLLITIDEVTEVVQRQLRNEEHRIIQQEQHILQQRQELKEEQYNTLLLISRRRISQGLEVPAYVRNIIRELHNNITAPLLPYREQVLRRHNLRPRPQQT